MKFVDEAKIEVRSGNGGPGAVRFRREKYRPKMGPDGGDGGRGGHVYFQASESLQSLLDFRFRPKFEAGDGMPGEGNDCNGHGGDDLVIQVPVGTQLFEAHTRRLVADLVVAGEKILVLQGGRGGLGNMNFATATRQAPDFAQPGEPGSSIELFMELKLLADVGLVGFPNAGKSTLISRLSAARPKIADYPFTTLVPNLGVVRGKSRDFVMADIPGLIEGAAEGRGLGVKFLKHCERTEVLVEVLDLDPFTGRTLVEEHNILSREMKAFSAELVQKPRIIVLNKVDAYTQDKVEDSTALADRGVAELQSLLQAEGHAPAILLSAVSGRGLDLLVEAIERQLSLKSLAKVPVLEPQNELVLGDEGLFGPTDRSDDPQEG
jgi:GTP-binding protein